MRHANIALFVPHIGCPHRCSFCDQNAISGAERPPEPADVTAACETALQSLGSRAAEAEIAFFGGSFTAIDRGYMLRLLDAARPYVRAGKVRGIRLSTRPDAVEPEVLSLLREYGVTTIELGAQSMDDRVLALNGRGHTADQVRRAACRVREMGFSLGLQMMTGLPGDTPEGAWYTARELASPLPGRGAYLSHGGAGRHPHGEVVPPGHLPAAGSPGERPALRRAAGLFRRPGHPGDPPGAPCQPVAGRASAGRGISSGVPGTVRRGTAGAAAAPEPCRACSGPGDGAAQSPGPVEVHRAAPAEALTRLAELGWQVTIREDTEIPAGQILPELE